MAVAIERTPRGFARPFDLEIPHKKAGDLFDFRSRITSAMHHTQAYIAQERANFIPSERTQELGRVCSVLNEAVFETNDRSGFENVGIANISQAHEARRWKTNGITKLLIVSTGELDRVGNVLHIDIEARTSEDADGNQKTRSARTASLPFGTQVKMVAEEIYKACDMVNSWTDYDIAHPIPLENVLLLRKIARHRQK